MNIGDERSSYLSMPANFQTADNEALCYAIDRQLNKVLGLTRKLTLWTALNEAAPELYDRMALNLNVPYYSSDYSDAVKRTLIQQALATWHSAGTKKAVEEFINTVFGDSEMMPWYKYDGEPYHFKISTTEGAEAEDYEAFRKAIENIKAARSVLDGIDHKNIIEGLTRYIAAGMHTSSNARAPSDHTDKKGMSRSVTSLAAATLNTGHIHSMAASDRNGELKSILNIFCATISTPKMSY